MASSALLPWLPLLVFATSLIDSAKGDNATVSGHIRINCGASVSAADLNGRTWDGDAASKSAPSVAGVPAAASYADPSLPSTVPYMTARVFASSYTYSFPVRPGRVFLRLVFYPSAYAGHNAADALLGVAAAGVTLLRDFNASQTALALGRAYLVREFSLHVGPEGGLDVTLSPSRPSASGSRYYAFVNGIEVVPTPADMFSAKPVPTFANGRRPGPAPIRADTAFQTMYRLNVGGTAVSPGDDSGLLYRSWGEDSAYILGAAFGVTNGKDSNVSIQYGLAAPPYAAPEGVYSSARSMGPNAQINLNYNLTWILPVDAGFRYTVRLHFCEIQYPITAVNQRVFDVYINNRTAATGMDVIARSGGIGRPVYADYLVDTAAAPGSSGQTDLWVELHPHEAARPEYYDAILNGLEVFKLQTYGDDSLAGPNPPIPQAQGDTDNDAVDGSGPGGSRKKSSGSLAAAWAAGAVCLVALSVGCACAIRSLKRKAAWAVADVQQTPARVFLGRTESPSMPGPAH